MSDLDLLRQYEPILRFTQGELFFPRAVDAVSYTHLTLPTNREV